MLFLIALIRLFTTLTNYTSIHSSWIPQVDWVDGANVLQGIDEIKLPCVWLIKPQKVIEHFGNQIPNLLSETEKLKGSRFHQPVHKERYEATHATLRILLGQLLGLNPAAIRFAYERHDKPILAINPFPSLQFNLSYTADRALIAIDTEFPIGIDIERVNQNFDYKDMLEACFSPREIDHIDAIKENGHFRFFTLWTRKEAILKLTGEGIGEHLPSFEVLDGNTIADSRSLGESPPQYIHIYTFDTQQQYIGSMATKRPEVLINFYQL